MPTRPPTESRVPSVLRSIFGPRFDEGSFPLAEKESPVGRSDIRLPGSLKAIGENWRQRWEREGDKVLIKFARKEYKFAPTQDWFLDRLRKLARSQQERDRTIVRSVGKVYGVDLDTS